jgi:hypothetical protein
MHPSKDTLDFIVIGAQKSGTSSLFQHLRTHPEIFIPGDKEAPYFSHDPTVRTVAWDTYIGNVARHVPDRDNSQVADVTRMWGTVTPHYSAGGVWERNDAEPVASLYDERTVPLRIRERLPNVRLVAILRDPVARAISHHRFLVRLGAERQTFDQAVVRLLHQDNLKVARGYPTETTGYIVWGEYGRILSGYFDVFPREQMLVVFTDELERNPAQLLGRIQEFIGVSADFQPANLGERYNAGKAELSFQWTSPLSWFGPTSPMSPHGVRRAVSANPAARAVWRRIPQERQRRLLGPYDRLASRAAHWNRRRTPNEAKANAQPSPATLTRLREHYREDGERLAALLEAAPPWLDRDADAARR